MKANGWKSMRLGAIALMSQYGLSCPASADGDVPMLRMNNLTTDGKLDTSDLAYVRLSNDEFEKYRLQKGDLLFNRTNSNELVGKTTLFELDEDYVFASYLIRFKLNPKLVDPRFVTYFFNTDESKDYLRKLASKGVSQSNINPTILKERFFVPVPPLQAQTEIAETLRCWDSAIEQIEKLVAAKTRIKRGLMQQLLPGKRRFADFEGCAVKSAEILNFVELVKDKHDPQTDRISYRCVELEHISQESGHLLGYAESDEKSSLKTRFKTGDVLFGKLRPYLRKYLLPDFDGVCTTEIWALRAKPDVCDSRYLFYVVQTNDFIQAANATSGSKMPRADWNWVSEIPIRLPSLPEQHRIAAVLNACDKEITLLKQQLDALKRQKRGLMQKLLTGQIRVKV
jgi:type I restriction enzyme S subunit